jgi:hypothetical protein
MNAAKLDKLIEDLRCATAVANMAIHGIEDSGTCNLDAPFVVVKPFGQKDIDCLRTAGFDGYKSSRFGWVVLSCGFVGQALRNTVYVETVAKYLKDRGWKAGVQYAVD